MQARGIGVMVTGIGLADPIELRRYASDLSYMRIVEDFSDLDDIVLEQAELLCPRKLQRS